MSKITWTHPGIAHILQAIPVETKTLLDVGCGGGVIGALCRIYRACERLVGVDAHAPALELCARHRFYDELHAYDLMQLPLPFGDQEFDVVTCVEVIEHVPRDHGLRLLDELERVARLVLITTPNGFLEQDELEGNPLQRHRSGWRVADFKRRGYRVRGVGGMLFLGRRVKLLSAGLAPLTRFAPRLSQLLLCVRDSASTRAAHPRPPAVSGTNAG